MRDEDQTAALVLVECFQIELEPLRSCRYEGLAWRLRVDSGILFAICQRSLAYRLRYRQRRRQRL